MTELVVDLKTVNSSQEIIYLPISLLEKLEIKDKKTVSINFGIGNKKIAKVKNINSDQNAIVITSRLRTMLMLPYQKKIILIKEDDSLRLGPLVGIVTTDYTGNKFANPKTYNQHPFSIFFKGLLAPESLYPGYYFVFTPYNVDWKKKTVNGYFLNSSPNSTAWELITIPLPDVVYNRIPNRTIERRDSVIKFKQEYLQHGGKLFNPDFFNKWDTYNILAEDEEAKKFIPETYLGPSPLILSKMLKTHPIIYLKPANGSLGLGIYKIQTLNGSYIVSYRLGQQNKSVNFKTSNAVYKFIFAKKNPQKYIIQQGIDLIEYRQSPVDFRVHLHKNFTNQWEVVAIGAKAAGKGSVTTHLRTGGALIDSYHYLKSLFQENYLMIEEEIKNSAIQIAEAVENKLNKPLGELGLDMGIDKNNNIWLFEVNSKPGRSIFKHSSLKASRFESSKRLLEYATFLWGDNLVIKNQ